MPTHTRKKKNRLKDFEIDYDERYIFKDPGLCFVPKGTLPI